MSDGKYAAIKAERKTGLEPFKSSEAYLDKRLVDFWSWYASDLMGNTLRGKLANPLNLDQWVFYVLATRVLNQEVPEQKSISLSRIKEIGAVGVRFDDLAMAIERAVS